VTLLESSPPPTKTKTSVKLAVTTVTLLILTGVFVFLLFRYLNVKKTENPKTQSLGSRETGYLSGLTRA